MAAMPKTFAPAFTRPSAAFRELPPVEIKSSIKTTFFVDFPTPTAGFT
jgi:hypothetical protein